MRRHPELAIRKPKVTSLGRVSSFNRTTVQSFFNNLIDLRQRHQFAAADLYNMDEAGVTTVQKPDCIVARRGEKQVGSIVSAERGNLVTVASTISASRTSIPPFFVFPRVNFKDYFLQAAPAGSSGSANKSGWMTEIDFLKYLEHFVKFANPSQKKPRLLILDNHRSHFVLDGLDFAWKNNIIMLTLPPHFSHKMQPLDRTVFGPLKKFINTACDDWIINHPGQIMTIHDIPEIVATAHPRAFSMSNIRSGFRCTGIFPLNRNTFSDIDFSPSFVTDRPIQENLEDLDNQHFDVRNTEVTENVNCN